MIFNKLIPFYLNLLGGILLGGSPIRDATEKYIISQFDVDISINMHTLKLDTKLKALVQNRVKQGFYRDELYYWTISNNDTTIAYAIAFALYKEVAGISLYGADFSYTTNIHFGELGRGCCEFWLAKCMAQGIDVSIAATSPLLDTNISEKEKLYGYHRLDNPPVVYLENGELKITSFSKVQFEEEKPFGVSGRKDIPAIFGPVEPEKY